MTITKDVHRRNKIRYALRTQINYIMHSAYVAMIARETSNGFKKLLIMDKCQQKLGVLQTTVHTGRCTPNYSLQTTARTHGSSPAEIDSELVSHRRLDIYQWWLVTGTRSNLQDFYHLLTQSPSYLQPIVTLLYTNFDVLRFCTETINYRH